MIQIKRVYEAVADEDGKRILVERLWPRGIKKEALRLDDWMKEAAPSDALRRWFGHEPAKWEEFQRRYREELKGKPEVVASLMDAAKSGTVSLMFSSHDVEHNNALALKKYLDNRLKTRRAKR